MRAIISVYDKTGIVDFARGLVELGVELIASGGTAATLEQAGLPVRRVEDLTGFPEMLGGRVKTLHPAIHAGILARRDNPSDLQELQAQGLQPVDVVVVNLYPFRDTVLRGASFPEVMEQIDIGGPTLLRAAAKNLVDVIVVCSPSDYDVVLESLRSRGQVALELRRHLAAKAFQHCAVYDTHVASYLRPSEEIFPEELTIAMRKVTPLRYGENPHQMAAFYAESAVRPLPVGVATATKLHGKDLSFNNTYDLDAAWNIVSDFSTATVAIVKHGNPCGLACGDEGKLVEVFRRALAGDPQAAFGGAVGVNRVVDRETAQEIQEVFFEDIIAPGYTEEALDILLRKRDLRVLATGTVPGEPSSGLGSNYLDFKRVAGGFLVQTWDALPDHAQTREVVTVRSPTLEELTNLLFAWRAVKHVHSNAIVLAKKLAVVGVGAGQMSRVDAVDLAVRKAGDRAVGSVLASDAFFPFPDGIERAAAAGVTAVIQPGGSIRDQEVIKVANRYNIAMIFTHERHFKH